ncbi:Integral membrane protein [Alkalibacterium sp. AK22]|uniref:YibE/F family protein n=1 Tax=Alkalibacterium sp. AK22 TaxID=1229520 RepID=UPI000448A768|nr:YibE/F family protein [Alkalibacterium sp. AK22]EXJ23175.1 Integral membrane protein [Alkalibacterium sp. AK22]
MKRKLFILLFAFSLFIPLFSGVAIASGTVETDEELEAFDEFDEFDEFEDDTFELEEALEEPSDPDEIERARVIEVIDGGTQEAEESFFDDVQTVRIEMLSGDQSGEELEAIHTLIGNQGSDFIVEPGDRVLVSAIDIGGETEVHIIEYERDMYIYTVLGLFIVLLILLGGKKGIKTIFTLAFTLLLLIGVLIPGLLAGYSPVLLTVLISIAVTVVTILTVGGVNVKSASAIIGVLGGVLISGLIAYFVGNQINLTGLSSQEAMMLMFIPQEVDFNFGGLLFAGIIMGALGAVMDVGMSIASAMEEIRLVDPSIPTKKLILAGLNVGKDIMGTMANTLILAYVGSLIPVLLLFSAYQEPFISIINMNIIATEVIRALAGSIGLILAIPLTAVSAGLLRDKFQPKKEPYVSASPLDPSTETKS